jgi:peptidoglycan/xylan/chitin deacetylase (PgdA/CDA1 family)
MTVDPGAHAGRLALTFDNLGEASELERGTWPMDRPLGEHPSVTVALPRLLDELDANALKATFFLEAVNCEMYPEAVREIAARGHEIGHHGWRHEVWAALSVRDEREVLERGKLAFADLGLRVRGFRPPGGGLTASSPQLLSEAGIEWCSPATVPTGPARLANVPFDWGELVYLPFDWSAVDAYQLTPHFAELRRERGDPPEGRSPVETLRFLSAWVDELVATGAAPGVLIMHPFLMAEEEWWECVQELLAKIAALVRGGGLQVAPGGELAQSPPARLSPS